MERESVGTVTLFLMSLSILFFFGCTSSTITSAQKSEGGAAKKVDAPRSIEGIWKSHVFGIMKLKQSGNRVWGSYDCNDGQLEGAVTGNRFTYRWWENVPNRPYEQAFKTHRGDGYFDILQEGTLLDGKWRIEDVAEWGGDWRFRKIR